MILDTSALLAVLLDEPEAERFAAAVASASVVRMSAASYVAAAIYVDGNLDESPAGHARRLSGGVFDPY
jgi:ribonuclease VapC